MHARNLGMDCNYTIIEQNCRHRIKPYSRTLLSIKLYQGSLILKEIV